MIENDRRLALPAKNAAQEKSDVMDSGLSVVLVGVDLDVSGLAPT